MKFVIAIIMNLVFVSVVAQPALNKLYAGSNGYTVIPEQNGYFIAGNGFSEQFSDESYYLNIIELYRVDSLGNVLWEKEFGKYAFVYETGLSGSAKQTADGGYIIPGFLMDTTGVDFALLIRIDSLGDTIWTRTFNQSFFFNDCIETSDNGFVMVGDAYLIKLDSAGNFLWQKSGDSIGLGDGYGINLMGDGGFILSGSGSTINQNCLIRTDSMGDTLWTRTYNSTNGSCTAFSARTGGFIMFGEWDTLGGINYIARLDTAGNIKWKTFYTDIEQVRELQNSNIILTAVEDFIKLDSNGNQLWDRRLLYNGPGPDSLKAPYDMGTFFDLQPTRDNGFVLTGGVVYTTDSLTQINGIWLVKTDSVGCIASYCGIEGIQEINRPAVQANLTIYPNPAQNSVTIEWSSFSNEEVQLVIYDLLGREVSNQQIKSGKTDPSTTLRMSIDVSGLENGMYVVRVLSPSGGGEGGESGKLVIMR